MKVYKNLLSYLGILLCINACGQNTNTNQSPPSLPSPAYSEEEFSAYWYSGKAEVASYQLTQSRYGELHEGSAVLIFVTEPFSKSKHVKLDDPRAAPKDEITVMKLNFTKNFNTGIYPYSMMLSTFTPVDSYHHPHSLKATMSGQEWCGHVFCQINLQKESYDVKSFSYFEKEGDEQFTLKKAWLEDEIWNKIRLNYKELPVGQFKMIPGLFYTRLSHTSLDPVDVSGTLTENHDNFVYALNLPKRTLKIVFDKTFPFQILSWEETYSGIGGRTLTTTATLDKTLHIDYWSRHGVGDSYLRDSLNLK